MPRKKGDRTRSRQATAIGRRRDPRLMFPTPAERRRLHVRGRPSAVVADPEIHRFVEEALPTMTFAQVVAECKKRFGESRAPSVSAVHRYWRAKVLLDPGLRLGDDFPGETHS